MAEIRDCPAPDPHPGGPTRYRVPEGAVDTHAHVIGLPPAYPLVADRSYTPPAAPADRYLAMLDATGMANGVLVQVSVHGTDNRLLLETLAANAERLRGIAVIPLGLPERDLRAMKDAGIVGLRLNVLYGGGRLRASIRNCRCQPISRLPVPFVVDHMGHMPTAAGLSDPGFSTLVALVRDGAWVKLSGAFRTSV
ncbi:MAG: GntR family transcriptional regulator, partial [Sphingobacteriales bacterium]